MFLLFKDTNQWVPAYVHSLTDGLWSQCRLVFPGLGLQFRSAPRPPLPPSSLSRNGTLRCVWLGLHGEGKARLRAAGEAEAAETSTHNGACEGGGGEAVAARLGGGMVGSEGGTKGRLDLVVAEDGGESEGVDGIFRTVWKKALTYVTGNNNSGASNPPLLQPSVSLL